jgi:hypothetical protein
MILRHFVTMQNGYINNLSMGGGRIHGCGNQQGIRNMRKDGKEVSDNIKRVLENEKTKKTNLSSETACERRKAMNVERRRDDFLHTLQVRRENEPQRKRAKKVDNGKTVENSSNVWGNKPIALTASERKQALFHCQSRNNDRARAMEQNVSNQYRQKGNLYHNKFRLL